MSKSFKTDLDELARLHALLMKFYVMPLWTPAMGAQLVSGILPVPDCDQIPDSACQLKNPQQRATQGQLLRARRVLESWIEETQDEGEEGPPLPSQLSPTEFVAWCEDSYADSGPPFRPEWLDYTLAFFRIPSGSSPPTPLPFDLVERALNLEGFASVQATGSNSDASPDAPTGTPQRRSFRKLMLERVAMGKARSPIAVQIGSAMDEAVLPFSSTEIWGLLCKVARDGKDPALKSTGEMSFAVPHGEGMRLFSIRRLSQYLGRLEEDLGDGDD